MLFRSGRTATSATPYGAAVPSYNPYETRPRAEVNTDANQGFDAPAPATYEGDSAFFPGGARPMAMPSSSFGIQTPAPYAPQQPYTQSYVPQQPAAQPYAQQPVYQVPAKPAANAKDDLGVPAFLRRGK